jgi:polyhydroxybutyrate depolymerase
MEACGGTDPVGYDFGKAEGEGEVGVWVHSGLYNREYTLHTPPGMDEGGSYPLLVFLHGAGDTGEGFERRLRADARTDAAGYITVYPDGMEGTWAPGCEDCTPASVLGADDVGFLETLVRQLAGSLPVDTTRVYLAGYSQGGSLAQFYACTASLPPAGIAVVAALLYVRVADGCAPAAPFPVMIVHGDADPVSLFGGFGPRAPVLSVPDMVQRWLDLLACSDTAQTGFLPDTAGDYTTVSTFRFGGCVDGTVVAFDLISGGGHTWAGDTGPWPSFTGNHSRNLDTTGEILDFFGEMSGR